MVIHDSSGQLPNLPCHGLTSLKSLHHAVSESGDHCCFAVDDSCAHFFDTHFLYLIACSFCTIKGKFRERIKRTLQRSLQRRFHPSTTVCPSASAHSSPYLSVSAHHVCSSAHMPDHFCLPLQSPICSHTPCHPHLSLCFCLPLLI